MLAECSRYRIVVESVPEQKQKQRFMLATCPMMWFYLHGRPIVNTLSLLVQAGKDETVI